MIVQCTRKLNKTTLKPSSNMQVHNPSFFLETNVLQEDTHMKAGLCKCLKKRENKIGDISSVCKTLCLLSTFMYT